MQVVWQAVLEGTRWSSNWSSNIGAPTRGQGRGKPASLQQHRNAACLVRKGFLAFGKRRGPSPSDVRPGGGRRSDHATSSIEGSLSQRHNKPNTAGPAVFLTLGGFLPACIAGTENPPANIRKTKSEKTKAKISRKEPSRTRMPPSRSWPDGRWHEAASQAQRILRERAASCFDLLSSQTDCRHHSRAIDAGPPPERSRRVSALFTPSSLY